MYNRFISILALSLALIVPATGAFADAPKKTVRIASGMSHDPHHIGLMEFLIPWFEEKLGDKYEFEVYPDNALGNYSDVFQGTVLGSIQFSVSTTALFSQFVPELMVLDMPYIIENEEQAEIMCTGKIFDEFDGYCRKRGVRLMSMDLSSFRIFQFGKPVKTMDDMRNIKFRTTSNKFHVKTINSFGMAATPMGPSEVLTALTQGVVGGADGDNYSPIHYRWAEGAPYIVMANHMPQIYVWCGSLMWLSSLPQEDQDLFAEGFRLYYDYMEKMLAKLNEFETLKAALTSNGCDVYVMPQSERDRLQEASKGVYDELPANLREICDRIWAETHAASDDAQASGNASASM